MQTRPLARLMRTGDLGLLLPSGFAYVVRSHISFANGHSIRNYFHRRYGFAPGAHRVVYANPHYAP